MEYLIQYKEILECLQYLAVIIGTPFIVIGVFLTIKQLRQNRDALINSKMSTDIVQAEFALKFLNQYGTQEMSDSLRKLRRCKEDFGVDFASVWFKKLQENDPIAYEIDKARRYVKIYYKSVYMLYKEGLIAPNVFNLSCYNTGVNLLYDIVQPMGKKMDSTEEAFIDNIKREIGYYETAVKSIPPNDTLLAL